MLASATDAVNALCSYAQDQPLADFVGREERVLETGPALMATWLGDLVGRRGRVTDASVPQVRRPLAERGATAA